MNRLTLKWGTLKGWELKSPEAIKLIEEYHQCPVSYSAMIQRDTKEQKEIILKLIDLADEILLDWENKIVTREEAKDYILNYGQQKTK